MSIYMRQNAYHFDMSCQLVTGSIYEREQTGCNANPGMVPYGSLGAVLPP